MEYVDEVYEFIDHAWSKKKIKALIAPLESLAYCTSVKGFKEVGLGVKPDDENYFNFFYPKGRYHDELYGDDFEAKDLVNDCICEAVKRYMNDDSIPFVRLVIDLMSNPRFTYLGSASTLND